MRFASEFCHGTARNGPPQEREAERRKARSRRPRHTRGCYHPRMLRTRRAPRMIRLHEPSASGALALRRSAAALVAGRTMHDSVQAALRAMQCGGITSAFRIALKPSTWRAGRHAGGVDARTARERLARPPAGTALAPLSGWHPESTLRGTSGGAFIRRTGIVKELIPGSQRVDSATFFPARLTPAAEQRRILVRIKETSGPQHLSADRGGCKASFAPPSVMSASPNSDQTAEVS